MTTITWRGEDDLHPEGQAGPSFTKWNGIKFPKDTPVEVDNPDMIRRAKGNRFFEVHESAGTLDSASGPPPMPLVQRRGPGRPPKVREPVAGED